eukprot:TRINITY_DN2673_c2_g1_i2.p1 TRINITY_DN2673_c2_g1~~TRINITY_DN2673_c2_g1_i2.p1  ORF type:complete len:566 (+),score=61.84 TRINITY_DN2673_c2_g1_i2:62-1699(+)
MAWRRFFFRSVIESVTSKDRTATGRMRQLTGEVSLLFGITTGSMAFMWCFALPHSVIDDGLARNALTKCWGSSSMYMTEKVLYQSESHRIYSLLHKSGDCMIYVLHFPTGKVWSTRLINTSNTGTLTQTFSEGVPVTEAVKAEDDIRYWKDDGVYNALSRWYTTAAGHISNLQYRKRMIKEAKNGGTGNEGIVERYLFVMVPFIGSSLYYLATFPVRYWFMTSDFEVNANLPKPIPGNTTFDTWTALLERQITGHPVNGKSSIKYDDNEMKIIICEEKTTESGKVTHTYCHMKLKSDDWAAMRINKYSDRFRLGGYLTSMFCGFMVFSRVWMGYCLEPHDLLTKSLMKHPGGWSRAVAASLGVQMVPVRFLLAATVAGHYFVDVSLLSLTHVATFLTYHFLIDFTVAWFVAKHAVSRVLPKDLAIVGDKPQIFDPSEPQREFLKSSRHVGNIRFSAMVEEGILPAPMERSKITDKQNLINKQQQEHQQLLARQGVTLVDGELKSKKELEGKGHTEEKGKPDPLPAKKGRRRHRHLSVGSVKAKDA